MKCNCSNRPEIRQEFASKFSENRFEFIASKERTIEFLARRRCKLFRCRSCAQHWQVDDWMVKDGYTSWPELCIRISSPETWQEFDDYELRRGYFPPMVNGVVQPDHAWRKCSNPNCKHPVVVGFEHCANCACRAMHSSAPQSRSRPTVTARVKQSTRPTVENRAVSVLRLWTGVRRFQPETQRILKFRDALDEESFRARDAGRVGHGCISRSVYIMYLALAAMHKGGGDASQLLRQAFSLLYWGTEVSQHQLGAIRRTGREAFDPAVLDRIWLHGLAAGGGAERIADWIATYLVDVFAAPKARDTFELELMLDVPFRSFIGHLMQANLDGRWPKGVDRMLMRGYGDLLVRAPVPEAFRKALVSFCDYRVAQAFGYDGMESKRRRSEDRTGSVLDRGGWIKLVPLELFSLQYVYQKATGKPLSLVADHPLLQEPFMKLPALLPLYEDDYIRRAAGLAKEVFGSDWKPLVAEPSQ